MMKPTTGAEREQLALENLERWARRNDWASLVARLKTKQLIDQGRGNVRESRDRVR